MVEQAVQTAASARIAGNVPGHRLTDDEIHWFHEGTYHRSYRKLGAHPGESEGVTGTWFTLWAPAARAVGVALDRNGWDGSRHPLQRVPESGLWSGFLPDVGEGTLYKYDIEGADGIRRLKADPYAFRCEVKPNTASIVTVLDGFRWTDKAWQRRKKPAYERPLLIYEVHLGSWKRKPNGEYMTYAELADELVDYAADLGYTHIELLPLAEHPFDRSWGYQATGYYAVTSRFGTPHDFMRFVDRCHARGLGVIMDWVPGHFVRDDHGLREFDGTPLYEHADPQTADRPGWGTLGFDYGKPEVRSFLISNALFWMDVYHIDGLRVDAVTSMIRLDFDKPQGAWRPNARGGYEHDEAIELLRKTNEAVFLAYPNALMMAEESSAWPLVTAPVEAGGLGFNYKWNMGWMNDTLRYFEADPIDRQYHQGLLTFPVMYAYAENFTLPLSHDEVVHGKRSLLHKMPGDILQKFAGWRALLAYWIGCPGKKLLFMGSEFGQFDEWKDESQLDWFLLDDYDTHRKALAYSRALFALYRQEKALWQMDHSPGGFEWIDHLDHAQNVIAYIRRGRSKRETVIIVCNFSPIAREGYRIGVPSPGEYGVLLNSDASEFGGSGRWPAASYRAEKTAWHGHRHSVELALPPLSVVMLKRIVKRGAMLG